MQVLARPDVVELSASCQALRTWSIFIGRWMAAATAASTVAGAEASPLPLERHTKVWSSAQCCNSLAVVQFTSETVSGEVYRMLQL